MTALLPCLPCKSTAIKCGENPNGKIFYYCNNCGNNLRGAYEGIDEWNSRNSESALRAENAKLRGSLVSISNMVYEASLDERNNLAIEIRRIVGEVLK